MDNTKAMSTTDMSRADRDELNALSKEVFGASSKWKKLIERGYVEMITEETTELVPGKTDEEEPTTRKVQVPVKRHDGALQFTTKHHTVESIKEYMLERKVKLEAVRAQIKKMQEEAAAKKAADELKKKVHADLHGSAT